MLTRKLYSVSELKIIISLGFCLIFSLSCVIWTMFTSLCIDKFTVKVNVGPEFRNSPQAEYKIPIDIFDKDKFTDLQKLLNEVTNKSVNSQVIILTGPEIDPSIDNPTLAEIKGVEINENLTAHETWQLSITNKQLYAKDDRVVENLLKDLKTMPLVEVTQQRGGSTLKLLLTFSNGMKAIFKPMRVARDEDRSPDKFFWDDIERHNAEIAAFHLDRLLGFRHVPPVVGRILNITTEIYQTCDYDLLKTFFISPDDNICFHGHCERLCDVAHAICGNPDTIEGSLVALLPIEHNGKFTWHPWQRSYRPDNASWYKKKHYCDKVAKTLDTQRLLDLMDLSVFDFLIDNADRHHFGTFKNFSNDGRLVVYDNGHGFGQAFKDDLIILRPLIDCCKIRSSTLEILLKFHNGEKLSAAMRRSLTSDPLTPILWEPHLAAIDRRVGIILNTMRECVWTNTLA